MSLTQTAAVANVVSNVGTLDATLTFSAANVTALTAGGIAGIFQVEYTPRNYTGSIINVGQGYTNS
jgi:aspartate oxidase